MPINMAHISGEIGTARRHIDDILTNHRKLREVIAQLQSEGVLDSDDILKLSLLYRAAVSEEHCNRIYDILSAARTNASYERTPPALRPYRYQQRPYKPRR